MTVAEKIRALREDSDKTQTQIAEILNVGQKTYSDYETQKIRIPLENVIKLAEYYDVDMNYICGLTKEPKPFPKTNERFFANEKPFLFLFNKFVISKNLFPK